MYLRGKSDVRIAVRRRAIRQLDRRIDLAAADVGMRAIIVRVGRRHAVAAEIARSEALRMSDVDRPSSGCTWCRVHRQPAPEPSPNHGPGKFPCRPNSSPPALAGSPPLGATGGRHQSFQGRHGTESNGRSSTVAHVRLDILARPPTEQTQSLRCHASWRMRTFVGAACSARRQQSGKSGFWLTSPLKITVPASSLKLKLVHLHRYSSAFPHTRTRTAFPSVT